MYRMNKHILYLNININKYHYTYGNSRQYDDLYIIIYCDIYTYMILYDACN